MDHGAQARLTAARVIDAVLHHGRSLKAELATALAGIEDVRDRALVEAMAFAAIRHHGRYAAALSRWMPRPPGARDAPLRALLYAGFSWVLHEQRGTVLQPYQAAEVAPAPVQSNQG